jgi:hypothetical protein
MQLPAGGFGSAANTICVLQKQVASLPALPKGVMYMVLVGSSKG